MRLLRFADRKLLLASSVAAAVACKTPTAAFYACSTPSESLTAWREDSVSAYAFRVPPEYAPVPAPDQSGDGALRYYAHGADTLAWRRGFGPMEEPHAEAQRWTTCEWDIGGRGLIDAWATADGYFTSAVTGDLNLPDQMLTFYAHTHSERAAVQALAALQSTRRAAAP